MNLRTLRLAVVFGGACAFGQCEHCLGRLVDLIQYRLPSAQVSAGTVGRSGDLYLLAARDRRFFRISTTGATQEIDLAQVPESAHARAHLVNDIQRGPDGSISIVWIWRHGDATGFSVSQFSEAGKYLRSIRLEPPAEVRKFILDGDGNIVAMGLDSEYFLGKSPECRLLHVYSTAGKRIRSFSPCPAHLQLKTAGGRPGADFVSFSDEIVRGQLWRQGAQIHQSLPDQRLVRTFQADGSLSSELRFTPPSTRDVDSQWCVMWRTARLADGRWLVDWATPLAAKAPRRPRFLAIHKADGSPESGPAFPEGAFGLLGNGDLGEVLFTRVLGPGVAALSQWQAER